MEAIGVGALFIIAIYLLPTIIALCNTKNMNKGPTIVINTNNQSKHKPNHKNNEIKALLSLLVSFGLLSNGGAVAADAFMKTTLDTGAMNKSTLISDKTSSTKDSVKASTMSDKIKSSTSDKVSSNKDSVKTSTTPDKTKSSVSNKVSSNKDSVKASTTSDKIKSSTSDKVSSNKDSVKTSTMSDKIKTDIKSSALNESFASLSDEKNALKSSPATTSKDLGKATNKISDKTKIGNMGSVDAGLGKAQVGMENKGSSGMNMDQMAGMANGGAGNNAYNSSIIHGVTFEQNTAAEKHDGESKYTEFLETTSAVSDFEDGKYVGSTTSRESKYGTYDSSTDSSWHNTYTDEFNHVNADGSMSGHETIEHNDGTSTSTEWEMDSEGNVTATSSSRGPLSTIVSVVKDINELENIRAEDSKKGNNGSEQEMGSNGNQTKNSNQQTKNGGDTGSGQDKNQTDSSSSDSSSDETDDDTDTDTDEENSTDTTSGDSGESEMGADGDSDFGGKGDFGMYGAGAGSETASEAFKRSVTDQVGGGFDNENGDYGDAGGGKDTVNASGGGQGTKGGSGWNEDESVYGSAGGGLTVDIMAPVVNPGMAMTTGNMQKQSANTARSVLPRAVKKQPVTYGNVSTVVQTPKVDVVNRSASIKAVAPKTEQVTEEPKAIVFVPNTQSVSVGRKAISQKATSAQKPATKRRVTGQ